MHYVHRFMASGCLIAIATACGEHTGTGISSKPHDLMVKLAAAGFDTVGAQVREDEVAVEGDIVIAKETINSWPTASPERRRRGDLPNLQWRATTVVDSTSASAGITVDLSGLSSGDWQAAARQAIVEWNVIEQSGVFLVEGSPADITVQASAFGYGTGGIAAEAKYPVAGQPGISIKVNTNFTGTNTASTR